ncbi:MAG TPA: NAD(P)-dependent oxidoreductase [Opitutaceae bacterium]|nr:NAD(P)-dependent oxidoreductase [Opitutaceae bacterium]
MRVDPLTSPTAAGLPCAPEAIDDFISRPTPGAVNVVARAAGPFMVLGAGGKIGLHLSVMLRRALDQLGRKDRVIAVSRFSTLRDKADFEERGVETMPCDLNDPASLARLPDAPTIFFLAGVKFGTAGAPGLLHATNVEMPKSVAAKFKRSRIVAYSSGCVYPFVTPASGGATEATPLVALGEYAASCIAREEAFTQVAAERGNPVALIRLNYSVEFRYGLLVDIAQMVLQGRPVDVTTGYVNVIWQTDAVAHSIQALEAARAPAVPINVTGADILSVRDLAHRFGQTLGRPVTITGQEADTAWLNNAALSHRLFGPPATSVSQMIEWVSAWLLRGGETWGKPTGFERRDGRF